MGMFGMKTTKAAKIDPVKGGHPFGVRIQTWSSMSDVEALLDSIAGTEGWRMASTELLPRKDTMGRAVFIKSILIGFASKSDLERFRAAWGARVSESRKGQ